jgi:MFS superfamily sulfate permease-like transporter
VGFAVGMLAASVYFIVRVGHVRYQLAYRGHQVHSKHTRPLDDLRLLQHKGRPIAVFELAGPLFVGSADRVIDRVAHDADDAGTIILGLRGVDEIDASGPRVLHVKLAAGPQRTADGYSLPYDVTAEPIPRWAIGIDPEPEQEERGPPSDWDGIDPPAADE